LLTENAAQVPAQSTSVQPSLLPQTQAITQFAPDVQKRSAIPMLIWSLVLVFVLNPVGTPLAIIAAYFGTLANAKDEAPQDAQRHLDTSFTLCLISSCTDALCLIAMVVVAILAASGHFTV
jgi:uncharacterized membrane protein